MGRWVRSKHIGAAALLSLVTVTTAAAEEVKKTAWTTTLPSATLRLPAPADWAAGAQAQARESDSLLNGALIGAAAGVASGLFLCRLSEPWRNCVDDVGPMIRIGAIGAGIGIGIDALIRRTIYQSPDGAARLHAEPLMGRRGGGLQLSLDF